MLRYLTSAVVTVLLISACSEPVEVVMTPAPQDLSQVAVGKWILDEDGNVMFDPQTSGLVAMEGMLVTVSDASADATQQLKLHRISPETATLAASSERFTYSQSVRRSCFFSYLNEEPDLEALAVDPRDPNVIYTVTEDATRTGALSPRCESKYEDTGSTDYPTLLIKLTRKDNDAIEMSGVRPLQFPVEFEVGNFPNDGIEGLAMASDGTLYLALEKDKAAQPRIFSLNIDDAFFASSDFATVSEPKLQLPMFTSGNHPINGLAVYTHSTGEHYLLGAARNDNELWVIDTSGSKATKRIPITFDVAKDSGCDQYTMDNASIEGLVSINDMLWIINDPWEKNYLKNATCEAHRGRYEDLAPLLFSLKISEAWFE